jgi:transcriptional regulator with XRE-family HTH domain
VAFGDFGEFIKGTRKRLGMTHMDVALGLRALGLKCAESRVSSWERGSPVLEKWLTPLSDVLDVRSDVLRREWEKEFPPDPVATLDAGLRLAQLERDVIEIKVAVAGLEQSRSEMAEQLEMIRELVRPQGAGGSGSAPGGASSGRARQARSRSGPASP